MCKVGLLVQVGSVVLQRVVMTQILCCLKEELPLSYYHSCGTHTLSHTHTHIHTHTHTYSHTLSHTHTHIFTHTHTHMHRQINSHSVAHCLKCHVCFCTIICVEVTKQIQHDTQ